MELGLFWPLNAASGHQQQALQTSTALPRRNFTKAWNYDDAANAVFGHAFTTKSASAYLKLVDIVDGVSHEIARRCF